MDIPFQKISQSSFQKKSRSEMTSIQNTQAKQTNPNQKADNNMNPEIKIGSINWSDTKVAITINGHIIGTVDFESSQTSRNMTHVVLSFCNMEYETGDGEYQIVSSFVPRGASYVSVDHGDALWIAADIPDSFRAEQQDFHFHDTSGRTIETTNR